MPRTRAGCSQTTGRRVRHTSTTLAVVVALALAALGAASCGKSSSTKGKSPSNAKSYATHAFHSPDRLPAASWRPFASYSPWNMRLPADPRLDPRSSAMVAKLLGSGSVTPLEVGTAGTKKDFAHAIYYANNSDPTYTVRGGSNHGAYAVAGKRLHLPAGARPSAGADHHLAVVYHGQHWGFFGATVDRKAHVIHCLAGRRIPIDGIGLRAAETAARFPSLGGRIRYQEMAAGRIEHALFAASSQIAYTWVYPAEKSDGGDNPRQGYPPMGERFQLDPSYMTHKRLATYPPWKRAVLKAIRDYGFFLGDSTSKSLTLIPIESGTSYRSFGLRDPWVGYARAHGLPSSYDSQIRRTVYTFDLASGVDWSKLRAIDPCVTSKDC